MAARAAASVYVDMGEFEDAPAATQSHIAELLRPKYATSPHLILRWILQECIELMARIEHGHDSGCVRASRSSLAARVPLENLDNCSRLHRPAYVNGQSSGELGLPAVNRVVEHVDGGFNLRQMVLD